MASFDANLPFGEQFLDEGMVSSAMSVTATHPIETRSDETHSILQRYMIENKLVGIGDAVGDNNQVHSHLLAVHSRDIVLLTSRPHISIPHSE